MFFRVKVVKLAIFSVGLIVICAKNRLTLFVLNAFFAINYRQWWF